MTIRTALQEGIFDLRESSETPFLDAVLLLSEVLDITKEKVITAYPEEISHEDLFIYRNYIVRRKTGVPAAYIRKKKEFFSLKFYVDERVLIPRPDTELLVETALELAGQAAPAGDLPGVPRVRSAHDLCTGSGCVAIAIKYSLPWLSVSASDISLGAGEVFAINSKKILGITLPFTRSDLLKNISATFDMITGNPPYLTDEEARAMEKEGLSEPMIALDGGKEGLTLLTDIVAEAPSKLNPGGYLLLEACPERMTFLQTLMAKSGFSDITIKKDLAERERVIHGRIPG